MKFKAQSTKHKRAPFGFWISNFGFTSSRGATTTLAIVFGAILLLLFAGILNFILGQLQQAERAAWRNALNIAEAGIDYYQWCLNHEMTGQCQNDKDYTDPSGQVVGSFSIESEATTQCGEAVAHTVTATGTSVQFPEFTRTVSTTFAKTSVGKYAFLLNSNVWAGADREIKGRYHSNGGIRMSGENSSLVTSARTEWQCTDSFGCDSCPTDLGCEIQDGDCMCPGVFGEGEDDDLWDWPVTTFDFTGITIDLADMKDAAQSSGHYFPPADDIDADAEGYHVILKGNRTAEVRIVTDTDERWAYSNEEGWHWDDFIIASEYEHDTVTIPSECSALFFEDRLWVAGEVDGHTTVASANLVESNTDTTTILPDDITYKDNDTADGFALISEDNALIGPQSPEKMELMGIFIAQKGRFARNYYENNIRDKLEIVGSVVSNGRVGTRWVSGSETVSGYEKRETTVDSDLIYTPPPFVPAVSDERTQINWHER